MPFWKDATISIKNIGETKLATICYQLKVVDKNDYKKEETGYFHIDSNYHGFPTQGFLKILDIQKR